MPISINSGTVTPQQTLKSLGDKDSVMDKLNKNKIGDNQVLYASSKGGAIKGNNIHKAFTSKAKWKEHKENARDEVIDWVKGFGLNEAQTKELVSHVETKFERTGELRGRDLKEIAKLAAEKLKPFAEKPFVCKPNADAKELTKANLWMALNKNQQIGAKGNYQNGFTIQRMDNPSLRDMANVGHALFSMTKLAQRPEVRQQQMVRTMSQLPPVPTHEIKIDDSNFKPYEGAIKYTEHNKEHDFKEAGNSEWKPNDPNEMVDNDNMKDFGSHMGYNDFVRSTLYPHINLDVGGGVDDAELLEIIEEEVGDDINKLDINSDFLDGLREAMYGDEDDVEVDYLDQLKQDNFVKPLNSYKAPSIIDDDEELFND